MKQIKLEMENKMKLLTEKKTGQRSKKNFYKKIKSR